MCVSSLQGQKVLPLLPGTPAPSKYTAVTFAVSQCSVVQSPAGNPVSSAQKRASGKGVGVGWPGASVGVGDGVGVGVGVGVSGGEIAAEMGP